MLVGNPRKTVAGIIDGNHDKKLNREEIFAYLVANNNNEANIEYSDSQSGWYTSSIDIGNFYHLEKNSGIKTLSANFDTIKKRAIESKEHQSLRAECALGGCDYYSAIDLHAVADFILGGKDHLDLSVKRDRNRLAQFMSVPKSPR